MKIIAIEGLDKSGKATASRLLIERLFNEGYKVVGSEHHRYDQPTGRLIMKWLKKEWDVDQKTVELIMTADKQSQQRWYQELENDGYDFLILDRYTLSQIVYGKANGIDIEWTNELQKYMRKPDIEIVIDVSAATSLNRKGKHNNGENDRYEADLEMLERVRNGYILPPKNSYQCDRFIIDGEKTIEEIHEDIYAVIQDNLIYGD